MELESLAALNGIRPSVYRAAMKLQTLQKQCGMDAVLARHIAAALPARGRAKQEGEVTLDGEGVTQTLVSMFSNVSRERPGEGVSDDLCVLVFRIFDRSRSGRVSAASFETALICLSAETPLLKYGALVHVAERDSGWISRSALTSLLQDVSLLLQAIEEDGVLGSVEEAVKSCFKGVLTPHAAGEHVLSWLRSEPRLLSWLPVLYRLSVGESVSHAVRCHVCKTFPITGLRYRCRKCVNVQVCQSCFLADRRTRRHKSHHQVTEFCKQPTVREYLSAFLSGASHIFLPRRSSQSRADGRDLKGMEPCPANNRFPRDPLPSDDSTPPAASPGRRSASSSAGPASQECSSYRPRRSSKGQQTDDTEQREASALRSDVRSLQRDKWIQERQLRAWRLTVQSEHSMLENRCCEMEVTLQTLKEQNIYLQGKLTQTLSTVGRPRHTPNSHKTQVKMTTEEVKMNQFEEVQINLEQFEEVKMNLEQFEEVKMSLEQFEEETTEKVKMSLEQFEEETTEVQVTEEHSEAETSEEESEDEDRDEDIPKAEDEPQTPPPTSSWDIHSGEGTATTFARSPSHLVEQKPSLTEAEPPMSERSEGMCSPEEHLQDLVDRLKTSMEIQWDTRWHNQKGDGREADLLVGLGLLEESIHRLVDAVTSISDTEQLIKTVYLSQ